MPVCDSVVPRGCLPVCRCLPFQHAALPVLAAADCSVERKCCAPHAPGCHPCSLRLCRSACPQLLHPRLPGCLRALLPRRLQQDGPAGRHQVQGVFEIAQMWLSSGSRWLVVPAASTLDDITFLHCVWLHLPTFGRHWGCSRPTGPCPNSPGLPHLPRLAGQVGRRLHHQRPRGGLCVHGLHGQPNRG